MPALLLGSISTIVEASELQREAFNQAFREHGLDWSWSREDYRDLLTSNGGEQRIAEQAKAAGIEVDAAAIHATKSAIFQRLLADRGAPARPGVADTIRAAKADGLQVAFVTTTTPENVQAVLRAVEDEIPASSFDLVVDRTAVDAPKPAGDVYVHALRALGEDADACVAVEDNEGGVAAAAAAGVRCAAFPNENTADHDFGGASAVVHHLALDTLRDLPPAA